VDFESETGFARLEGVSGEAVGASFRFWDIGVDFCFSSLTAAFSEDSSDSSDSSDDSSSDDEPPSSDSSSSSELSSEESLSAFFGILTPFAFDVVFAGASSDDSSDSSSESSSDESSSELESAFGLTLVLAPFVLAGAAFTFGSFLSDFSDDS